MEWLLVLLAGGGAGGYAVHRWRGARAARREHRAQLQQVRRLADEDVTVLGEQLARLDEHLAGADLDAESRDDYQRALDAYQSATREAPRIEDVEQISALMDSLAGARYAIACVQARVAHRPVPEWRVPCFFNPQHGPSATDIEWRFPRSATRRYPVCRQCAARAAARQPLELRTVTVGSRVVPYWEAGAAFRPYTEGYFGHTHALGAAMAWAWATPVAGGAGFGHHGGGGWSDGGGGGYEGEFHGGFDGGAGDGGGGY